MRKVLYLLTVCTFFFSLTSQALASDLSLTTENTNIGAIVETQATEDFSSTLPSNIGPLSGGSGTVTYEFKEETPKTLQKKLLVKYLTESWAQASSYTWSKSNSTNLTFSGNVTGEVTDKIKIQFGLSGGFTTTYSVAITLPADSTKFSKLAYGSDFYTQNLSYVRSISYCTIYDGCHSSSDPRKYISYKEPTSTTYLYVVYK
ncbi:hypothetical protein NYE70_00990 [Paenibacillus sp. FSL R5-0407]|uniref:hypothetical protein n=1 Tax=Paenibacillus sp. FSL R5-0407 TaxID=2975320 RepID=UPI0030F7C991